MTIWSFQNIIPYINSQRTIHSSLSICILFSIASPIIITQPQSQTFKDKEKNILTLWIIATGIGPIYYQWQKYDHFSNNWIAPSTRADNTTSLNLTFSVITEEDEGLYRCIASNDDGSVVSDYANITVYGKDIHTCLLYVRTYMWSTDGFDSYVHTRIY